VRADGPLDPLASAPGHFNVGDSSSQVQHSNELHQSSSMKIEETKNYAWYLL
jgi:hypothetical protein